QQSELVAAFQASHQSVRDFCAEHGVSQSSLMRWQRKAGGRARAKATPTSREHFSPEERRQAVEAYLKSGMTFESFAVTWGVSSHSLSKWVRLYRELGPKSLEGGFYATPGKVRGRAPIAQVVVQEIQAVQSAFPTFGLRKVRDYLQRFRGV